MFRLAQIVTGKFATWTTTRTPPQSEASLSSPSPREGRAGRGLRKGAFQCNASCGLLSIPLHPSRIASCVLRVAVDVLRGPLPLILLAAVFVTTASAPSEESDDKQ